MIVYHGSKEKMVLANKISPRYGLVVLFFTNELYLAKMYAGTNGHTYQAELKADKEIDFKGGISHSPNFRNLIFRLSKEGYDVVAINNVLDRPSRYVPLEHATIYVVFEPSKIKNFIECTL